MYETGSCAKKRQECNSFLACFLVKFSVAHFMENMPKVVGFTVVFSSSFCPYDETFR
jgi:hypothetical protein